MTNARIIQALEEIGGILKSKNENTFKIRAYLKLSKFLSTYEQELENVYKTGGMKALTEVPNIGAGIGKKIAELIDTGKLGYLDELKKSPPEAPDEKK
jgi:DNA polymerase (family 10)